MSLAQIANTIKRILSLLVGAGLIALAIWLGLKAKAITYQPATIWFALAAALLFLISLLPISYGLLPSVHFLLKRVLSESEIDRMVLAKRDREEKGRLSDKQGSIIELSIESGFLVACGFLGFSITIYIFIVSLFVPGGGRGHSENTVGDRWVLGAAILGFGIGFVAKYRYLSRLKKQSTPDNSPYHRPVKIGKE